MADAYGIAPAGTGNQSPTGVSYQQVNPDELVSNQLQGLLQSDSPYIRAAQAQGLQQATARGLLNGSMAAGSAENAAIAAALPIAQGNAQEYAQIGASNQQAANQFVGENIAGNAQLGSARIGADAQLGAAGIYAQSQLQQAQLRDAEFKAQLAQQGQQFTASQSQQFQEYGMGLGQQYAQMQQQGQEFGANLNQNAFQFNQTLNQQRGQFETQYDFQKYALGLSQQNNLQNGYMNMWGSIMSNPNLTAEQRSQFIGNANAFYTNMSQANAAIPAWTPPWVSDPSFWRGG